MLKKEKYLKFIVIFGLCLSISITIKSGFQYLYDEKSITYYQILNNNDNKNDDELLGVIKESISDEKKMNFIINMLALKDSEIRSTKDHTLKVYEAKMNVSLVLFFISCIFSIIFSIVYWMIKKHPTTTNKS